MGAPRTREMCGGMEKGAPCWKSRALRPVKRQISVSRISAWVEGIEKEERGAHHEVKWDWRRLTELSMDGP